MKPLKPARGTTALQLDPLASISARGFLVVVAAVSIVCAIGLTLATTSQISSWPLAVAAIVAVIAGFGWFIRSAFRFDLGVTSDRFATSFALVAIAAVLNSLSCVGTNAAVRDDWGLITIGLVLMAAAPFRTHVELGTYTGIAVGLTAVLTVLHLFTGFGEVVPAPVILLVAVAPSLAMGLGAVAYARSLVLDIYAERLDQAEQRDQQLERLRQEFVDDDVIGEVGGLRSDVVPFLARLRMTGTLSVEDRVTAGRLATALHAALVEAAEVDSLGDHVDVLVDESGLSPRLHEDDRATVRALLAALEASPLTRPGSIVLELIEGEEDRFAMVRCASDDVQRLRTDVLPFIRMIRLMFPTASEQIAGEELLVHFDVPRLA